MTEFAIHTIGGGALLAKGFNAIAMLIQDGGTVKAFIRLGILTGITIAMASALYEMKLEAMFKKWALPAFLMLNFCFLPTAKVQIIDRVGGNHAYKVDHVPWFLAAVAGTTSTIFKVVTEKFEQAFSEVDDLQYTKTGVMFGSQLLKRSKMFNITDPVFNRNLKSFVNQCVTFAALRGKWYTIDDLRHTNDLWGLVSSKSNWVIHFPWREPGKPIEMCPCREGINRFNAAWKGVIKQGFKDHAPKIFSNISEVNASRELKKYLPLAFEQILEIQSNAEDIMKQQMMTYATIEAIDEKNYQLGNPVDVAISRAHLSQEMTHGVLWGIAAEHLPAMKAVFEMLIYMCLLLLIPLVFLPHGYKILGTWMGLVFWVHLWTPLFAIIYGMVTFLAQRRGISVMGAEGYTLATSVGITETQKTMESIAGSLAMSIPFISYALVKGGASSFVHLASHLGGVTQGASSQAAHEAMTGNYSAGNMSFGNTTMASNSTFRQNHGASYSNDTFTQNDGMMSVQTASDGSFVMNQNSSHMRFKMDESQSYASGLSQQAQTSHAMGDQQMVSASQSEADSYRKTMDYSLNHAKTIQNSNAWERNESTTQDKALSKVHSLAEDFAKENNLTTEQAGNFLLNASLGGKGGILGGSIDAQYRSSGTERETFQKAQKFAQDHRFDDALKDARHSAVEGRFNENEETQRRLAEDISGSVEKANQYRTEAQKHYQKSETYSNMASFAENNSASLSRDNTQPFLEWLASQPSDQGTGRMGMTHAKYIAGHPKQQDTLQDYQQRYMNEKVDSLKQHIASHPASSPEQVFSSFQGMPIKNPVSTIPMEQVRQGSPEFEDFKVPSNLKEVVHVEMAQDRRAVENQGQSVVQQGTDRVKETEEGLDQSIFSSAVPPTVRYIAKEVGDSIGYTFRGTAKADEEINALKNKIPGGGKK